MIQTVGGTEPDPF